MFVAVSFLLAAPLPATAAEISFACDPASCIFAGSQVLDVYVNVDATTVDLRGATLSLDFDPSIVHPIAVEPGALLAGSSCSWFFMWLNQATPGDGHIDVDLGGLGCSVDGPGTIIHLQFTGVNPGSSPLTCASLIMRDSLNQTLDSTCVGGLLTYEIAVPAEPLSWGLLKSRYRD
jgi:hypothetical protein